MSYQTKKESGLYNDDGSERLNKYNPIINEPVEVSMKNDPSAWIWCDQF